MLRTVVAATDFSEGASRAVRRAAMVAAQHGAALEIVHGVEAPAAFLARLGLTGAQRRDDAALRARLDDTVAEARALGARAEGQLVTGTAASEIERRCERAEADLLVVGAHGAGSRRETVVGTTAERLVECGRCDTLVVKATPNRAYSKALACVALVPASEKVLASAAEISPQAAVFALYVYDVPFELLLRSYDVDEAALERARNRARREAHDELGKLLQDAPIANERLTPVVREGAPFSVILEAFSSLQCDVVAIGRTTSPARELFLGSVTKRVLRAARGDVLVAAA